MIAVLEPKKDSHEPLRSSHPRRAAQLTSAGAVSERNPAMTPMEKQPRYRTALLTFMPVHSSCKGALVLCVGHSRAIPRPYRCNYVVRHGRSRGKTFEGHASSLKGGASEPPSTVSGDYTTAMATALS